MRKSTGQTARNCQPTARPLAWSSFDACFTPSPGAGSPLSAVRAASIIPQNVDLVHPNRLPKKIIQNGMDFILLDQAYPLSLHGLLVVFRRP